MFIDHCLAPAFPSVPIPFPFLLFFVAICKPLSLISAAHMQIDVWPSTGACFLYEKTMKVVGQSLWLWNVFNVLVLAD